MTKYNLVNVTYPAPYYRRTFEKTGQSCTPEVIDGIIDLPDCGENQDWIKAEDGDSVAVGCRSNALDEMNARNAARTWGLSGYRNQRTGKEY